MRIEGESPFEFAKEERDCLCGNYPNGTCYICAGEQAKRKLQGAAERQSNPEPGTKKESGAEDAKPKGIADDARWKALKKKLDIH